MRIISISHCWLTKAHPDPKGLQLRRIVAEMDSLWINDEDLVFYDWCSLYQDDDVTLEPRDPGAVPQRRTSEQKHCFDRALKGMELLFCHDKVEVIVIPEEPEEQYGKEKAGYWSRGWCFFELCVANHFKKVLNPKNIDVLQMVYSLPEDPNKLMPLLKGKKFRHFQDTFEITRMMGRVFEVGGEGELRAAAEKGTIDRVSELLKIGTDPKAVDSYGRTALHRVAMVPTSPEDLILTSDPILGVRANIAKALLTAKADPEMTCTAGYTPLEMARICGQVEVAAVLTSSQFVKPEIVQSQKVSAEESADSF